jgi:hypothetical protein
VDEVTHQPLPPYVIEAARSGRSRCKTCRRKIDKEALRIGMLIEGPYGTGYLWHHLRCAARRRFEQVEEAYRLEAWREAKAPPKRVPDLDELRRTVEEAEQRRERKPTLPYAERDPSGRARCKHCGEPIEKGSLRVVLGREVEFGGQVRTGPVQVHPRCVAAELRAEHCATKPDGFAEALRANSSELPGTDVDRLVAEIGPL